MALNLCSNLPGSDIEGDRIMVLTSANEPIMKAYSAGGEAGKIYGGIDGVVVDNENDTIGLNDEVWNVLDSYTETSANFLTSADIADFATETYVTNEIAEATQNFITSADIPEIPVVGFENNGVLDTDYDGIKITNDSVGNEHVNLKKGESWYNHGLLVPTSPGNDKYLTTTSAGHLSWDHKPVFNAYYDPDGNIQNTSFDDIASAYNSGAEVVLKVYDSTNRYILARMVQFQDNPNSAGFAIFLSDIGLTAIDWSSVDYTTEICKYYRVDKDPNIGWSVFNKLNMPSGYNSEVGSILSLTSNGSWPAASWVVPDYATSDDLSATSAAIENQIPEVKDLVAGNGINISATSGDVTISVDNSVFNGYATETWTAQNYFPIDGLQVVSSSAEASGANIIYIVSGSNQ
jgi:hypothetical protein